jgi:hypothetical protein
MRPLYVECLYMSRLRGSCFDGCRPYRCWPRPPAATRSAANRVLLRRREGSADHTAALSRERYPFVCGPVRRNGAVRARCLVWLLHRRTDSRTWRGGRRRSSNQPSRSSKSAATPPAGDRLDAAGAVDCAGSASGDLSGPLHGQLTASARPPVDQLQLMPKRSGAAEGVGDGRRPAPVQIDHSGRRGPFSRL